MNAVRSVLFASVAAAMLTVITTAVDSAAVRMVDVPELFHRPAEYDGREVRVRGFVVADRSGYQMLATLVPPTRTVGLPLRFRDPGVFRRDRFTGFYEHIWRDQIADATLLGRVHGGYTTATLDVTSIVSVRPLSPGAVTAFRAALPPEPIPVKDEWPWPVVSRTNASQTFVRPGMNGPHPPFQMDIPDLNGDVVYRLACVHAERFSCALLGARGDPLLPSGRDRVDRWTMRAVQLHPPCAASPYGTTREFRFRGMRVVLRFSDVRFLDSSLQSPLREFTFTATVEPDASARDQLPAPVRTPRGIAGACQDPDLVISYGTASS